MGKRIRWIWVISLSAALAAIGVQGYWLFNQFRYEMCTYADEIAGEVFHAGQEEFRIRKEEAEMTKGTYIIERQSKYQSGDSVLNGLKNSFGFQLYPKDTTKIHSFRLHLDPNMPEDSLLVGVDRSVVEFFVPFSAERLDSILSARSGLSGTSVRSERYIVRTVIGLMVPIIEKPVFNLYLDMLCVRPDRANGGVGGCGSSHKSVFGPDGMAAFPKYFPYLVIAGLLGFPDPYDLGANALERVA